MRFEDMAGLRGSAGLTLGASRAIGGTNTLPFYVTADAVHEFEGKDGITFATGATAVRYRNDPLDTYAHGRLGVTIGNGQVAGFVEGEGVYRDGYKGGGGRAGLRFRF